MMFASVVSLLVVAATSSTTLSLEDALAAAAKNHPRVRDSRAQVAGARARVDETRSSLFPQVDFNATYQYSYRAGQGFNFGLGARQLIYDFGRTYGALNAAKASARAEEENEKTTFLELAFDVRTLYFSARAQKALITVAQETLANQERHHQQVSSFIEVGTRPAIDLAQTKTDLANARVQLVNAESDYESTKAQLNRAIGVEGSLEYDVHDHPFPAIDGEDDALEAMLEEALKARPELAAMQQQVLAQEAILSSVRAGYLPSISAQAGADEGGRRLDEMEWNVTAGVFFAWPIFEGGATRARTREAEASIEQLRAQADSLRQEVRLELSQVRASLRGAKEALVAAGEAVASARVRLELAEGRYQTGVGNIIELADAQLALTAAEAQQVQADFNLAAARARLIKALGRDA